MKHCIGITKKIRFCKNPTGGKLYCSKHLHQPKYFLFFVFISILLSYIAGIIPKPWDNTNKSFSQDDIKEVKEAVLELKNFLVKGNKELVDQIPKNADWDLREGTVFIVVSMPTDRDLWLIIQSKNVEASLKFTFSSSNYVQFEYSTPQLGTISKKAKVFQSDFKDKRRLIISTFLWTLNKESIEIFINGKKRV